MNWQSNSFLRLIRALWRMGYGDVLISWISWRRAACALIAFLGGFALGAQVPNEWVETFVEQMFHIELVNDAPEDFNDVSVDKPASDAEQHVAECNKQEILPWEQTEHSQSGSPSGKAGS